MPPRGSRGAYFVVRQNLLTSGACGGDHNFLSSLGRHLPIPTTGVAYMLKKRFDLWMALCVLFGVVLVLLAGFHRLGVDLELPIR